MNTSGFERPLSARSGHYSFELMNRSGSDYSVFPQLNDTVATGDFAVTSGKTYSDMWDDTQTVITGGAIKVIVTGATGKVGILLRDTADGDDAGFALEMRAVMLPLTEADSPTLLQRLYFNETTELFTTTVGTNIPAALALDAKVIITTDEVGELPAGHWILAHLRPVF